MRRLGRLPLWLWLLLSLWPSVSPALPTFKAVYQVQLGRVALGDATMRYQTTEDGGTLRLTAEPKGMVKLIAGVNLYETAHLRRNNEGRLYTHAYTYKVTGRSPQRRDLRLDINTQNAESAIVEEGKRQTKTWHVATNAPSDRLAFAFALADDVHRYGAPRAPFEVLDGYRYWQFEFTNEGRRNYRANATNTPAAAVPVVRYTASHDNMQVEAWLDPARAYFPVRIWFDSAEDWSVTYRLRTVTFE